MWDLIYEILSHTTYHTAAAKIIEPVSLYLFTLSGHLLGVRGPNVCRDSGSLPTNINTRSNFEEPRFSVPGPYLFKSSYSVFEARTAPSPAPAPHGHEGKAGPSRI